MEAGKRVDIIMRDGQRRRATAKEQDGRIVLMIAGVALAAHDYAMQDARVIVNDAALVAGLRAEGYNATQPDKALVAAKLSPTTAQALADACEELGINTSTAVAYALELWLQSGHPYSRRDARDIKGRG